MRIHLWCLGVSVIMDHMQALQLLVKMLHKLRAVVGEDELDGKRKYFEA
jgi:hypothetical protein